jgi:hypothetical protein
MGDYVCKTSDKVVGIPVLHCLLKDMGGSDGKENTTHN